MLGIGLSLRISDFRAVVRFPKAVVTGLVGQMLLLPMLACVVAIVFRLPPEIAVGLMIIALAPGGATSNLFTYLSKGDVALSVSLTALASLITPFTIPLIAALSMSFFMGSNTEFEIPIARSISQLLVIMVIPISLGVFANARWPLAAGRIEKGLRYFSVGFLLFVIALIVLKNADAMPSYFKQSGMATLVLNLTALFIGYRLGNLAKLSFPQSVSIGFEVGIQNGTLALVVAGTLIGNDIMMIPAVTYSLIMLVSGSLFAWWVNRCDKRDPPGPLRA